MKEKKSRNTFVLNSTLKTFILLSIRKEGTEIKDIIADPHTYIPSEVIKFPHSWRDRKICVRVFHYDEQIYTREVEVWDSQSDQRGSSFSNLIRVGTRKGPRLVFDLNGKLVTSLSRSDEELRIVGKERQYMFLRKWNIVKQAYIYTIYSIRYKTKWTMILPVSSNPSITLYDEPIEKTCGEVEIGKYSPRKDSTIVEPIIIYNRNV